MFTFLFKNNIKAPTGVATLVETGGFPIKFKEGTNIPEIVSNKKEV